MAGELAFFELGVADTARGRAFYERLFGWTFSPGPGEDGYMIATPGVPGGMHGGDAGASPYAFFRVDDIEAAKARVVELGGGVDDNHDVEGEDDAQDQYGRFVLCRDDQGSPFGLFQAPAGAAPGQA